MKAHLIGPFHFPASPGMAAYSCYAVAFTDAPERGAFPAGAVDSTPAESLAHAERVVAAYNAPDATSESVMAAWGDE